VSRKPGPVELTLHIPPQDVETVTTRNFDADQVADSLAFADACGATSIVMHRYWGLVYGNKPKRCDRDIATAGFNDVVAELARTAPNIRLLVENMGHYFLASRKIGDHLAGPLDHFFPWDVADFRKDMSARGLTNVQPFIDVAHATLSANLFNHFRQHKAQIGDDVRYQGITETDLSHAGKLHPFDFIDPEMPWLHISDSHYLALLNEGALPQIALTSEGLEVGTGNLPFGTLPARVNGGDAPTVLLLEVEPGANDTQVNNTAQCRSLDCLRTFFQV